jgi:hypothetical protein
VAQILYVGGLSLPLLCSAGDDVERYAVIDQKIAAMLHVSLVDEDSGMVCVVLCEKPTLTTYECDGSLAHIVLLFLDVRNCWRRSPFLQHKNPCSLLPGCALPCGPAQMLVEYAPDQLGH